VLTDATADLAFTLLLSTARRVPEGDAFLRAGKYAHWRVKQEQMGVDVFGATLGLFGLGQIGRAVARRARGFDMTVLYHDVHRLPAEDERELGVTYVEFEELLARSDFVSVHSPLTDTTRHRFDAAAFAAMKPGAAIYNVGRGPVIDTAALIAALESGHLGGAGLDVTDPEPLPAESPLWDMENVLITAHTSGATPRYWERQAALIADNIRRIQRGDAPRNLVDLDAGY